MQENYISADMVGSASKICFGEFVLDEDEQTLLRKGERIPLPPKAVKLLSLLVENRGKVLEKEFLIDHVWNDAFVEDGNLAYTVRLIRRALDDDAAFPRYLQTVPRRGYRFLNSDSPATRSTKADPVSTFAQGVTKPTPLIGRADEIERILQLLFSNDVQLVTLTGPGGSGKTRLARELASKLSDYFSDGVFFVDLSTVAEPGSVLSAIAYALDIRDGTNRETSDLLVAHFRERSLCLILDNFEQVVTAGVDMARLLRACPQLRMLVTSREPLKLTVENECRLSPLELPPVQSSTSIAELMGYAAVELFVERARAVRPNLTLTEADGGVLAEICRRLDGLPLAIELAASRVKVLSPKELLARLEDRIALLTGGSKDLPDRQRTMAATIEWSYDLLKPSEKWAFAALAIFEGGFSFDAADQVLRNGAGSDVNLSKADAVDAIASLVDKGLLLSEASIGAEIRFRMLVVVRDYALSLLDSTQLEGLRKSHSRYYAEFAENFAPLLFSEDARLGLDQFEVERDNLRAAIKWSLLQDVPQAARLLAAVRHLAALRLHTNEIREWLQAVASHSADVGPELLCEIYTGLGIISQYQLDLVAGRRYYDLALEISECLDDKRLISRARRGLAAMDYMVMDVARARKQINSSLALSTSIGDEFGRGAALSRLADICNAEGNHQRAVSYICESLEIFRKLGYQQGISGKLANLAITYFFLGHLDHVRDTLSEGLIVAWAIGDEIDFRVAFEIAAALSTESGDYATAARLSGVAAARCEDLAYYHEPVEQRFRDLYIRRLRQNMGEAEFEAAFADGRKLSLAEAFEITSDVARRPRKRSGLRLVG